MLAESTPFTRTVSPTFAEAAVVMVRSLLPFSGAVLDMHPVLSHDLGAEFDNLAAQYDFLAGKLFLLLINIVNGFAARGYCEARKFYVRRGDGDVSPMHHVQAIRYGPIFRRLHPGNGNGWHEINRIEGAIEGLAVMIVHEHARRNGYAVAGFN